MGRTFFPTLIVNSCQGGNRIFLPQLVTPNTFQLRQHLQAGNTNAAGVGRTRVAATAGKIESTKQRHDEPNHIQPIEGHRNEGPDGKLPPTRIQAASTHSIPVIPSANVQCAHSGKRRIGGQHIDKAGHMEGFPECRGQEHSPDQQTTPPGHQSPVPGNFVHKQEGGARRSLAAR